jgi:hypothetical protein
MSAFPIEEIDLIKLIEPRVAGRVPRPPRYYTHESLESLYRVLELHRAAVVRALIKGSEPCPGEAIDVQLYDGEFVEVVRLRAAAVCQVLYDDGSGLLQSIGGGSFVKTPNLLLTAGHVVPPGWADQRVGRMVARFGFERRPNGTIETPVDFEVVDMMDHCRLGLDFVVLETGADPNGNMPSDIYEAVPFSSSGGRIGDPTICIQHPNGNPKGVAIGAIRESGDWFYLYDNFTDRQSSGSPVLDRTGAITALHISHKPDGRCFKLGATSSSIQEASTVL